MEGFGSLFSAVCTLHQSAVKAGNGNAEIN